MVIYSKEMTRLAAYTVKKGGLYEIHAEVQWNFDKEGHRFFHVKHEPVAPCVSEAIEAIILYDLSDMKQRMTGHVTLEANTVVMLEVWADTHSYVDVITFEVIEV